jgi:DNA-binding NtrC family response regulator
LTSSSSATSGAFTAPSPTSSAGRGGRGRDPVPRRDRDLTADAQSRLLRFLNDQSYERLGDAKGRRADVRIIAATNRPLEAAVRAGIFREHLFFRLNVIALTIPPLRERQEDILPLALHYLRFFGRRQGRHDLCFAPQAEQAISWYFWPGNLRELRNAVERAVILSPARVLEAGDLGLPAGGLASEGDEVGHGDRRARRGEGRRRRWAATRPCGRSSASTSRA